MLRFILAISLLSLVWAANAASPLTLLSQQCLEYQLQSQADAARALPDANESQRLARRATQLERQLIGLYNLKDSVDYYRQYDLSSESRETLLQCQLHLADQFSWLVQSPELKYLSIALQNATDAKEKQLGERLTGLIKQQTTADQKAKLHSLEASIKHALSTQSLSLIIGQQQCQLPDMETQTLTSPSPFSESIASYLLAQEDKLCRQKVWQAYQLRAKQRNQLRILHFIDDKQNLAAKNGYPDYASYQLAEQYLSTPALVGQFLDAITAPTVAPWDLGLTLSQTRKTNSQAIATSSLLDSLFEQLEPFGIRAETVTSALLRVWHEGRLLGDIYLHLAPLSDLEADSSNPSLRHGKIQASRIRQNVIGHQFGQGAFSAPAILDDYRAQQQAIDAMSQLLAQLLKGGHYYLLNTLGESQDSTQVGEYWLSLYLSQRLLPALEADSRESYLYQYETQLKVYRSKLALALYQNRLNQAHSRHAFKQSFNQDWPLAADAIYSFGGILDEGPLYYQSLWQKRLAQLIYQNGNEWQKQQQAFTILLINEAQLPFSAQLQAIFGEPVSPAALIKRIQHVPIASEL